MSIATEPLASPTFASSLVPNKIDIHTHTYVYIYICVCDAHVFILLHINYTHTRTQTHTHAHKHTHIYIYIHSMIVVMHKYKNDQKCTTAPLHNVNWLQSPQKKVCLHVAWSDPLPDRAGDQAKKCPPLLGWTWWAQCGHGLPWVTVCWMVPTPLENTWRGHTLLQLLHHKYL